MKISISASYDQLSGKAANDLIRFLSSVKNPLVCLASGSSPAGLYRELAGKVKNNEINISEWNFIGLDEWANMNGNDEGSCRFHLDQQFFHPLKIAKEKIFFFNGRAKDMEKECRLAEDFIQQHNGIDVAVLGLGLNGHIGMNEPGTPSKLCSHISDIDLQTQQVGQKYFSSPKNLSKGLTLGISNILSAKKILLLVNGNKKAAVVKRVLEDEPSEKMPASLLRDHSNCTIYLDEEAAQFISI